MLLLLRHRYIGCAVFEFSFLESNVLYAYQFIFNPSIEQGFDIRQKMFTAHSLLYLVETGTRHSPKSFPQKVFWEREIVLIRTRTPPRAVM